MTIKPCSLLILGGTAFLGRHLTEIALAHGHRVTLFNRGQTNADLFPAAEKLRGDRSTDLSALTQAIEAGRHWDTVIDVAGYLPHVVRASAELLRKATDHYAFVSTISVYADFKVAGIDESYPAGTLSDDAVEAVKTNKDITGEAYGPLKARCENEVIRIYGDNALVIRPGLIVGPHDPTDRFTYWPHRVAQGGDLLAPDRPEHRTQVIDVRDLAEWTLRMIEQRATGTYNATGPESPLTLGALLDACVQATGNADTATRIRWVDEAFLLAQSVQPWSDLPLWIPSSDADSIGFDTINCAKAIAAGLPFRPIAQTVRDTLEWDRARNSADFKAGITREREIALLEKYEG